MEISGKPRRGPRGQHAKPPPTFPEKSLFVEPPLDGENRAISAELLAISRPSPDSKVGRGVGAACFTGRSVRSGEQEGTWPYSTPSLPLTPTEGGAKLAEEFRSEGGKMVEAPSLDPHLDFSG